jgi:hypothetical protein
VYFDIIWTPLFALAWRRDSPGFVMMMFDMSDEFPEADHDVPDCTVHLDVSRLLPLNSSSKARVVHEPKIPFGALVAGAASVGGVYVRTPDRTLPSEPVALNE